MNDRDHPDITGSHVNPRDREAAKENRDYWETNIVDPGDAQIPQRRRIATRAPPAKRRRMCQSPLLERQDPNNGAQEQPRDIVPDSSEKNVLSTFLGALTEGVSVQDPTIKLNLETFVQKGKYHSSSSRFGLMQRSASKGQFHSFSPADFASKFLPQLHPDIFGQIRHKLSRMPTAGTTRDNCLKPSHFDMRFIGFPRMLLGMIVEHSMITREDSGQFSAGDLVRECVECHRILDSFCIRYDSGVQSLVVQRFGDRMVAEKGNVEIANTLREVIQEITISRRMISGFESSSWNGFTGSGVPAMGGSIGNQSNGRQRNRNRNRNNNNARNGQQSRFGGYMTGGNTRNRNHVTVQNDPEWNNPESSRFIPRGYCKMFHGAGSCSRQNCRYSHQRWSAQEERDARDRMSRERNHADGASANQARQ